MRKHNFMKLISMGMVAAMLTACASRGATITTKEVNAVQTEDVSNEEVKAEEVANAENAENAETVEDESQENTISVGDIFNNVLKLDTHSHVDVPMEDDKQPGKEVDLRTALENAGMNGIIMTFAVDYVNLTYPDHGYDRFINAIEEQAKILEDNNIKLTLNGEDLESNRKNGEPIIIQSVEGAHFLNGDVDRLGEAYDLGLRVFTLLHDNDADPALGDVYTNEPQYDGLTELGIESIKKSEELGMLVDLAHASDDAIKDALEIATKPLVISHTGLNTQLGEVEGLAKMMYPRLISPETAKLVADNGGVIGVWPHLANSAEEYAENIKAMVDIVGIDHVMLGTDTKITPEVNEWSSGDEEQNRGNREGKSDGEGQELNNKDNQSNEENNSYFEESALDSANHVWSDDADNFYYSTIRELVKLGFTEEEIGKITGDNFARVFAEATK